MVCKGNPRSFKCEAFACQFLIITSKQRPDQHSMSTRLAFKASDLLKEQEARAKLRRKNYRIQYQKCLSAVASANKDCHKQYTQYTIPLVLPADPHFTLTECIAYLKEKLTEAEFYVKLMQPGNVLLISWLPEDVLKVQKKVEKKVEKKAKERQKERDERKQRADARSPPAPLEQPREPPRIDYQPTSALSNLSLRSSLMRDNPKYDHLKSMQRLKRKKGSRKR